MSGVIETILLLSAGGALGANARYFLGRALQQLSPTDFPWGTLFINLTGAFLLGLFYQLSISRGGIFNQENSRLFFAVGFLGSFTTFSTLAFDTAQLSANGAFSGAIFNSAGSLVLGVISVLIGMAVARGF